MKFQLDKPKFLLVEMQFTRIHLATLNVVTFFREGNYQMTDVSHSLALQYHLLIIVIPSRIHLYFNQPQNSCKIVAHSPGRALMEAAAIGNSSGKRKV